MEKGFVELIMLLRVFCLTSTCIIDVDKYTELISVFRILFKNLFQKVFRT